MFYIYLQTTLSRRCKSSQSLISETLRIDLPQVLRQNSRRSTHVLDYGPGQIEMSLQSWIGPDPPAGRPQTSFCAEFSTSPALPPEYDLAFNDLSLKTCTNARHQRSHMSNVYITHPLSQDIRSHIIILFVMCGTGQD